MPTLVWIGDDVLRIGVELVSGSSSAVYEHVPASLFFFIIHTSGIFAARTRLGQSFVHPKGCRVTSPITDTGLLG